MRMRVCVRGLALVRAPRYCPASLCVCCECCALTMVLFCVAPDEAAVWIGGRRAGCDGEEYMGEDAERGGWGHRDG